MSLGSFLFGQEILFPPVQKFFSFPHFSKDKNYFSLQFSQANIFETGKGYETDFGLTKISFLFSKSFGKNLGIQVYTPFVCAWGGFMDSFIDNFHKTFNFPGGGRKNFPYWRIVYSVKDEVYLNGKPYLGISEPELFLSLGKNEAKLRIGTKIPLRENGFSSGKFSFYLGGEYRGKIGEISLWTEAGGVFLPFSRDLRSAFFHLKAGAKYKRLLLEFIWRSSPYREGEISHHGDALSMGFNMGKGITLGAVEDLAPYDTSADFTIFVIKKIKIRR